MYIKDHCSHALYLECCMLKPQIQWTAAQPGGSNSHVNFARTHVSPYVRFWLFSSSQRTTVGVESLRWTVKSSGGYLEEMEHTKAMGHVDIKCHHINLASAFVSLQHHRITIETLDVSEKLCSRYLIIHHIVFQHKNDHVT